MKNIVCYNIRLYRTQMHLTQQDLADMLGVSRSCICLWESGSRFPKYSMLIKLADLFNLPVEVLAGNSSYFSEAEETELLERYRNASDSDQNAIKAILGMNR